jgi:hypothetical protein
MDVMEEMTTIDIGEVSTIDRAAVAGSLDRLPTKATEIAQKLHSYNAIFALGGKSLITILHTEGSAVPAGMQIFQLSADARDLGRTYSSPLGCSFSQSI